MQKFNTAFRRGIGSNSWITSCIVNTGSRKGCPAANRDDPEKDRARAKAIAKLEKDHPTYTVTEVDDIIRNEPNESQIFVGSTELGE